MPDPAPEHNPNVGGTAGNAAAPPALGALEAEVFGLPRLTEQFGSDAALARMARMQSVSLAQGSPFTKAEASSQQFGQALHTQLFGDQQATGQHIAGQYPFAHGMR